MFETNFRALLSKADRALQDAQARYAATGAPEPRVVQRVVRVQADALVRQGVMVRERAQPDVRVFAQAARSAPEVRSERAARRVRLAALSARFVRVAGAARARVCVLFFQAAPVAAFVHGLHPAFRASRPASRRVRPAGLDFAGARDEERTARSRSFHSRCGVAQLIAGFLDCRGAQRRPYRLLPPCR